MRVHVVNVMRPEQETAAQTLERFSRFSQQVEAKGFHRAVGYRIRSAAAARPSTRSC